jgi:hypothetical protein
MGRMLPGLDAFKELVIGNTAFAKFADPILENGIKAMAFRCSTKRAAAMTGHHNHPGSGWQVTYLLPNKGSPAL